MLRRRRATPYVVAFALLAGSTAGANGRPPLTNGIVFAPGDAHSLYVRTTFGLLISHDDGCTFDWVCDAVFNISGTYDPKVVVTADGAIFTTSFQGLWASRDGGCTFQGVPGDTSGRFVDPLTLGPTGELWTATTDTAKPGGIYASTDNGVTFTARGSVPATAAWHGIVVAPSSAKRVYASGTVTAPNGSDQSGQAHVLISDDDGATWAESPLANVTFAASPVPRVAAVDPANADVVYLVSEGANPPTGDLLYRSTDGGTTWTQVLATTQPIRDSITTLGARVLVPTEQGGTFQSTDGGATFAPLAGTPQLSCLGARADGSLIGCGENWDPDFMAVASSHDRGATWQKVWRFVNLDGPLACPAGTIQHDACAVGQWDVLRQQFGATGPTCGSHVWQSEQPPPPTNSGGCCEVDAGATGSLVALAVAGAWAGGAGARRRRQRTIR